MTTALHAALHHADAGPAQAPVSPGDPLRAVFDTAALPGAGSGRDEVFATSTLRGAGSGREEVFQTSTLPGAGLPNERFARVAARRAFVDLKLTFLQALVCLADAPAGGGVDWLRRQVRNAEEPVDLWLLRAPMFAALAGPDPERRRQRQALRRSLESLFPDSECGAPASSHMPLN